MDRSMCICMDAWIERWIDGRLNKWVQTWMMDRGRDKYIHAWGGGSMMNGWVSGCMHAYIYG